MARTPVRVASVLIAAGVVAASPSVASAAPKAPAAGSPRAVAPAAAQVTEGGHHYKLLAEPPSDVTAAAHYWKSMSIKGQKQKKGNWCGPAAAASALTYQTGVKVTSSTQSYLAKKMATDKIGFTSPIAMGREMTNYINKAWHRKGTKYKAYRSITNPNLWDGVRGAYYYGEGPVVITVYSRKSWYPKAPKTMAHYVVIYGFDDTTSWDQSTYLIWDPAHGKRTLKATQWQKIAYAGRFVVAWSGLPF
ncbi:C39 family peptidase [Actinoallomurus soli]|uniref:C39 family peptidase n=1 Tax=Actinoallomurus soli TaxID=2952535 RepID=UPI002092B95A|nr:C39 family peptidase [Actinoallomurus soli]MCO5971744.1 C39 family peptidase [Actinoallomurus soli]